MSYVDEYGGYYVPLPSSGTNTSRVQTSGSVVLMVWYRLQFELEYRVHGFLAARLGWREECVLYI